MGEDFAWEDFIVAHFTYIITHMHARNINNLKISIFLLRTEGNLDQIRRMSLWLMLKVQFAHSLTSADDEVMSN